MTAHRASLLLALLLVVMAAGPSDACPNCSGNLATGKQTAPDGQPLGSLPAAYNWGIVALMSLPYLVLGSLGCLFYRLHRQGHALAVAASLSAEATAVSEEPERL